MLRLRRMKRKTTLTKQTFFVNVYKSYGLPKLGTWHVSRELADAELRYSRRSRETIKPIFRLIVHCKDGYITPVFRSSHNAKRIERV